MRTHAGRGTTFRMRLPLSLAVVDVLLVSVAEQTWGFNVVRRVQHSNYEDSWTPATRGNASFLAQSGTLAGLTDLHRGLVLDVTPELTDRVDGAPAEPMLYIVNGFTVGGAYRVNAERDALGNLNATGMRFTGMCDAAEKDRQRVIVSGCHFGVYGMVAGLAAIAAAHEDYASWDYTI